MNYFDFLSTYYGHIREYPCFRWAENLKRDARVRFKSNQNPKKFIYITSDEKKIL